MSLAKLFVEVGADVNQFERGMKQVRSDMDQTAKHASFFADTLSTAIGTGISRAVDRGIAAIANLGKSVIQTGIEFNALEQNSTLAFETMLKDTAKAKAFLADLKQFAKTTPFELPGLIESSQRLLAFGFDAQAVIPTLTAVGDAVAGLGGSPEKLNRVLLALGQIKAKGKIAAGEMLQLTEAGIPAWDMLAKKIGKSIPEAMKLSERGMIDSQTAINAIIEGMNKRFGGLMGKQAKSWTGMLSNIKDTFTQVTGRVMKPFFDVGLKGMDKLLNLFNSPVFEAFVQKMVKGSTYAADFISKVGKGLVSLFSGDYKSFFGGLFGGFEKLNSMLAKYENKRFGWLSNFTPKEAITAIKGFINDLKYGGKNLQYWIDHTPRLLQPLEKISIKALEVWKYLAGEGIRNTLKKLGSILVGLGSILTKLVRPFKEALGGLFEQLSTMKTLGFADIFKAVLASIAKAFSGFLTVIKDELWPTVKGAIVWVFDSLVSFVSSINWGNVWSNVVGVFTALYDYVTGVNWSAVWNTITEGVSGVVAYVTSWNWPKVWEVIGTGLSALGDFFKTIVFPGLKSFVDWIVSWFTDPTKNTMLLNAITATWNFVSTWASYIWAGVEPYLSSFFSWLSSWFTDATKRQQLIKGITTTWSFVSDWAISLVDWITPPLTSFFRWLVSWFTDSTKRSQLWKGITTTWSFVIDWGKSLVGWLSPYVSGLFNWLISWVTDPTKRTLLYNGIVATWTGFTDWASGVWSTVSPYLATVATNLQTWIDTNYPNLGSWIDAFVTTSKEIKTAFDTNFPELSKVTNDASTKITKDMADMVTALKSVFLAANDGKTIADWGKIFASIYTIVSKTATGVVSAVSTMVQSLVLLKQALGALGSGDLASMQNIVSQLNNLAGNMQGTIIEDIAKWMDPLYWIGLRPDQLPSHATGGITKGGLTLVGEKGPELVNLPRGSRVWDHGQSMGKLQSGSSQSIEIVIKNEGAMPTDRKMIDEIALQLQRRLTLNGNRVVFA